MSKRTWRSSFSPRDRPFQEEISVVCEAVSRYTQIVARLTGLQECCGSDSQRPLAAKFGVPLVDIPAEVIKYLLILHL